MAIINKLDVDFKYEKIKEGFDIFCISSAKKSDNQNIYLNDIIDKLSDDLKAESVAYGDGRFCYVMFKKSNKSKEEIFDDKVYEKYDIQTKNAEEIDKYMLFRLFLFGTSNNKFKENKFNNITGKLFLLTNDFMTKNGKYKKSFKALNITFSKDFCINASATSFISYELYKYYNPKGDINVPKYVFEKTNMPTLRRVYDNKQGKIYVRKSEPNKKATKLFFQFCDPKVTKSYFIHNVVELVNKRYKDYLKADFKNVPAKIIHDNFVLADKTKKSNKKIDKYIERCKEILKGRHLNFVSFVEEKDDPGFEKLIKFFNQEELFNVSISKKINKEALNIVYVHEKKFYKGKNDPYKNIEKEAVVQHITKEEFRNKKISENGKNKSLAPFYNTCLKELVIKQDILINKDVTIDDWQKRNFEDKVIIGKKVEYEKQDPNDARKKVKETRLYFMIINPDGSFAFEWKLDDLSSFKNECLNEYANELTKSDSNEAQILVYKNSVMLITRTEMYALPSREVYEFKKVSRKSKYLKENFNGVININTYSFDNESYYSCGLKGSGINTTIPTAAHLYNVKTLKGENVISEILETMAVPFVKYNNFTVMPYIFKYLNEYIQMVENEITTTNEQ